MTFEINTDIFIVIILIVIILILIRLFQILSGVRGILKKNDASIKAILENVNTISASATGIADNVDKNKENITNIMEGTGKITKDVSEISGQAKSFVESTTTKVDSGVGSLNDVLKSASSIMDKFGAKVE